MQVVSKNQAKKQGVLFFSIVIGIVLVGVIMNHFGVKIYMN